MTSTSEDAGMTARVHAQDLSAVSKTMLATLYSHALESRRPGGLIRDPRAEELVARLDYDFAGSQMDAGDQAATCVRLRQFDRVAQAFLAAHPEGVVVHIGCGLDARFDRVDNGQVISIKESIPRLQKLQTLFRLFPPLGRGRAILRYGL